MQRFSLKAILNSHSGGRWVLADFLVGLVAMWAGISLSPHVDLFFFNSKVIISCVFGFALVLSVRVCGLYAHRMQHLFSSYDILIGAAQGAILAFFTIGLIVNFTHLHLFGRYVVGITFLLSFLGIAGTRALAKWHLGKYPMRIVLLGGNELTLEFGKRLLGDKHFRIVCVACSEKCEVPELEELFEVRTIIDVETFAQTIAAEEVELVVSCYKNSVPKSAYDVMEILPFYHIDLINKGAFLEFFFREISVTYRNLHWQSSNFFNPARGAVTSLKRFSDLALSLPLIVLTLPVWGILALLIKLDSKGPAIYSQTRTGLLGKPFTIYKFRTMGTDAEKDGARWASKGDARITRVGAVLRRTRLDELPQLWNVLRGDMSFVGPRPERPEFVEILKKEIPLYDWRLLVKPGLTGWAQILFRYGDSVEDARRKLQYDLYYIKNFSLRLDLQIVIRTFHLLMKGSQ